MLAQVEVQIRDAARMLLVRHERRRTERGVGLGEHEGRGIRHDSTHPLGEQPVAELRRSSLIEQVRRFGERGARRPQRGIRSAEMHERELIGALRSGGRQQRLGDAHGGAPPARCDRHAAPREAGPVEVPPALADGDGGRVLEVDRGAHDILHAAGEPRALVRAAPASPSGRPRTAAGLPLRRMPSRARA